MNIQLKKTELEEHTQTIDGHYIYIYHGRHMQAVDGLQF